MTRDTFDAFTPPERGRFGDNEQSDSRCASDRDDLVDLPLYRLRETEKAVLLSPTGASAQAQWVPKSLVEEPASLKAEHSPGGPPSTFGRFKIAKFKAENLGWLILADEKQGALL